MNLSILINSCDAYSDVLYIQSKSLEEFWPDCTLRTYINRESSSILDNGWYPTWGARLKRILEKIETDYILMIFDDFILEDFVDIKRISKILDYMNSNNDVAAYYVNNLIGYEVVKNDNIGLHHKVSDNFIFRVNSCPAIWRKKDLISSISWLDSPWIWEAAGGWRKSMQKRVFYQIKPGSKNIFLYNDSKGGAIYRGKWNKNVISSKIKKYKLNIDFNIRGFNDHTKVEKRSFLFKVNFLVYILLTSGPFVLYKIIVTHFLLKGYL